MSRIQKAFENKKAFIAFLTAGDPSLDKTEEYILEMERAGADLIEIGIPFSDPIAEGPVIQEADIRALSGGVTTDDIFDMVKKLREKTEVPAAVGFGIHTPDQAAEISKTADGVIVGSAVVKLIEKYGSHAGGHLYTYVRMMKEAVSHSE